MGEDLTDGSMNTIVTTPPTPLVSSSREVVDNAFSQFCSVAATSICDNLPDSDPFMVADCELADWMKAAVSHWAVLRRQVKNWRSDPQQRYTGLDWGQLAVNLVELLGDQITLELGCGLERDICGRMLERVSQVKVYKSNENEDRKSVDLMVTRELVRSESVEDISWLKEIRRLAGMVSSYILKDVLPSRNIGMRLNQD